jgi:mercuric ion transport protein
MTDPTRARLSASPEPAQGRVATWADGAGVLGAVFAALCCMGTPVIISVLTLIGLSWLRQDAILWPLMFLSLAIAFWGLSADLRRHGKPGPLIIAGIGAIALVAGVIFVHGAPARFLIYAGALALVAAAAWNIAVRLSARRSRLSP